MDNDDDDDDDDDNHISCQCMTEWMISQDRKNAYSGYDDDVDNDNNDYGRTSEYP